MSDMTPLATGQSGACPLPGFRLVGLDGNAFAIVGRFTACARRAGWSKEARDAVVKEATSGDYNHLLATFAPYEDDDTEDDDE